MKKSEIEEKISENSYRLSKLEQRINQLEEENATLKEAVQGGDAVRALSDELYEYIGKQHQKAIEHVDNTGADLGNRIHVLSDDVYAYVDKMVLARDDALNEYKSQEWLTKFGFDNMISELQLNAVEQIIPGNRQRLEVLRDTHVGEKCFVIGNGPSLKAEDLDKLKEKEIFCFASKGIYNIFEETEWRPDVWAASDLRYTKLKQNDLNNMKGFPKLVCAQSILQAGIQIRDAIYYPFIQADRTPRFFNQDVTRGVHFYGTVTGKLINFAVYMGFKEIYLLGCDNTSPVTTDKNGNHQLDLTKKNHFTDKYYRDENEVNQAYKYVGDILEAWKFIDKSFADIKYFCDQADIKIYNATRGGELEVFPRISVDEILN